MQASRSLRARVFRLVVALLGVATFAVFVKLVAGALPSGTHGPSLVVRASVGLGIGVLIVVVVRRMLHALAEKPPPPPATVDARATDVIYECPVCGTRVRLEVAATTKAPKHCGEDMEPRLAAP